MLYQDRLTADDVALLVVDIQEKFVPHLHEMDRVIQRSCVMIRAAQALDLPIVLTEQYPQGLGHTVAPVKELLADQPVYEKTAFSALGDDEARAAVVATNKRNIVLVGIEMHVCISQTAIDLVALGLRPFLAVDAISSRRPHDADIALQRLSQIGVVPTTTEAVILEILSHSKHPAFKDINALIK